MLFQREQNWKRLERDGDIPLLEFQQLVQVLSPYTAERCWKLAWGSRRFSPRTPGVQVYIKNKHPEGVQATRP